MPSDGTHALLDLDPGLGAHLDERRRDAARAELTVRQLRLARGSWNGGDLRPAGPDHLGLLLIDGAIAREVVIGDTISTELLGAGDLIRPWRVKDEPQLLGRQIRWQVLAGTHAAVLDHSFGDAVLRYPEVTATLLDRLADRAERLATMKAIAQVTSVERRLLALFWHLAERWSRPVADGVVVVPLTLSHRLLGELVGARRPTVSSAAAKLERDGRLTRRSDGTWLIADEPTASAMSRSVSHRRRLLADQA
jgi:hypothetical protein